MEEKIADFLIYLDNGLLKFVQITFLIWRFKPNNQNLSTNSVLIEISINIIYACLDVGCFF